jgi:hypothetical protein
VTVLFGYLLLTLVIAAVIFYAVVALLPTGLTVRPERDNRPLELPPDRRMQPDDLDRVRIPVSLRGYRFAETDDLIDRLAAEIVVRDEEIARLRKARPASFERPRPGVERPDVDRPSVDRTGVDRTGVDRTGADQAGADEPDR